MIRIEHPSNISNVITQGIIEKHQIITRRSIVSNSLIEIEYYPGNSYLHSSYENLFLNSDIINDQSLVLNSGIYIVSCKEGTITIPFHGAVSKTEPFVLRLDETEEVFFTFSNDCKKPMIVKDFFNHTYIVVQSIPNFIEFEKEIWDDSRAIKSLLDYADTSWEDNFLGGVILDFHYLNTNVPALMTSFYFLDDEEETLSNEENYAIGCYEDSPAQSIISFYKDENNFLSININADFSLELNGKNSSVEVSEDLGILLQERDQIYFFFAESTVYIKIQNQEYIINFESLFEFLKVFIGFNGINNYLNNGVIGVRI